MKKNKKIVASLEFHTTQSATKIKAALKELNLNIEDQIVTPKQVQVNVIKDENGKPVSL